MKKNVRKSEKYVFFFILQKTKRTQHLMLIAVPPVCASKRFVAIASISSIKMMDGEFSFANLLNVTNILLSWKTARPRNRSHYCMPGPGFFQRCFRDPIRVRKPAMVDVKSTMMSNTITGNTTKHPLLLTWIRRAPFAGLRRDISGQIPNRQLLWKRRSCGGPPPSQALFSHSQEDRTSRLPAGDLCQSGD